MLMDAMWPWGLMYQQAMLALECSKAVAQVAAEGCERLVAAMAADPEAVAVSNSASDRSMPREGEVLPGLAGAAGPIARPGERGPRTPVAAAARRPDKVWPEVRSWYRSPDTWNPFAAFDPFAIWQRPTAPAVPFLPTLMGRMLGQPGLGWPMPNMAAFMPWAQPAGGAHWPTSSAAGVGMGGMAGSFASFRSSGGHAMAPVAALMAAALLLAYALPNLPAPMLSPWRT